MDFTQADSLGFVALQESLKDFYMDDGKGKPVPFRKIDEISFSEMYIGTSYVGGDTSKNYWRICKVLRVLNTTNIFYPSADINIAGDTGFKYAWDDRASIFPVLPP
jgi:hypothetical protein